MKEYENLAASAALSIFKDRTEPGERKTVAFIWFVEGFEKGFLKAREEILKALPNSPDIDFNDIEQVGEKEIEI